MAALTTAPVLCDPLYILLKGNIEKKIEGALSYSAEDPDYYDGETYSKVIDASNMGNAHQTVSVLATADTIGTSTAQAPPTNASGSLSSLSISGGSVVPNPVLAGAQAVTPTLDAAMVFDTVPGITKKTRTLIKFWSAAAAGGSVVGWAMWDQIIAWGPAPAVRIK